MTTTVFEILKSKDNRFGVILRVLKTVKNDQKGGWAEGRLRAYYKDWDGTEEVKKILNAIAEEDVKYLRLYFPIGNISISALQERFMREAHHFT